MTLGTSPERIGARDRVLGRTRFGADLGREGDLFLACARAASAPARILEIDPAPALALPGVVRVFTADDIPGQNRLGIIPVSKDQEFLAQDIVKHPGQAAALVAAESAEAARAGARAVMVRLQDMPGVFDPAQALDQGAPLVHPDREGGNLLARRRIVKGDAEAALAASAVTVTARYTTSGVEHCALETEGGRAEIRDGKLVVWACTQNPHYDQADLALFLGLDPDQVRVIQAETGGGFGGKLDLSVQPYLALAAWLLRRPVRMTYTREETFLATAKRHPFDMTYTTGADEQGRITAVKADLLSDTGAFASYGLAVCMRAAVHAAGPYFVPHAAIDCRMAYTHNPWNGAMRGFGVPQVALAHEGQMDALARALGMDPLEIRLLNALRPGQSAITGQTLSNGVGVVPCLEALRPYYEEWRKQCAPTDDRLRGVGLGAMFYGIGNTGMSNPAGARLEWTPQGEVILYTGAADIGQGSDTALMQIAAARLGLDLDRLELVRADTGRTVSAGATSASRQTYISGNAVFHAAEELERLILDQAADMLEAHRHDLVMTDGVVRVRGCPDRGLEVVEAVKRLADRGIKARGEGRYDPEIISLDPETGQGAPYEAYAFAAQAVLASVDRASAMVKAERAVAAHDVGKVIHRQAVEGQIKGGVVMGLGMALMEEFQSGSADNFQSYHAPTAPDAPDIETIMVEEPAEAGPFGAKGVGEPALIPAAPAVASAVGRALGKPMRRLPLSLERVMAAMVSEGDGDD